MDNCFNFQIKEESPDSLSLKPQKTFFKKNNSKNVLRGFSECHGSG